MEGSSLIAAVTGGNSTVGGGVNVILDITAIDPDEVLLQHTAHTAVSGRGIQTRKDRYVTSSPARFKLHPHLRRKSNTGELRTDTLHTVATVHVISAYPP